MPETDADRLKSLEERIAKAKVGQERPQSEDHHSQAQVAWRMVIELVAGLGIGFAMGYGIDALLGTTPIFMVIFLFFGLAAGVQTMMRTAEELRTDDLGQDLPDEDEED